MSIQARPVNREPAPKKKKRNPAVQLVISLLLLGASAFFIWNIFSEARITYSLLVDLNEAQTEYSALLAESEQLENQKEKLQDPNYVENYARGEYMITKEGEAIYHLPAQNSDDGE